MILRPISGMRCLFYFHATILPHSTTIQEIALIPAFTGGEFPLGLKVKSFLGTSKNALLSQLWIALIAYLMLSYLKFRSKFQWSVYTLMEILPVNIFSRRYIWDWLNDPYHQQSASKPPGNLQLNFNFV